MSQNISSLDLGDLVYNPFTYDSSEQGGSKGFKRANSCIRWRVVDKTQNNGVTLVAETSSTNVSWDAREASNPDSDRKNYGNSRYKFSNVLQWLNSDASKNWYTAKHTYDEVVASDDSRPGYLYRFGSNFKSAITSVSRVSVIPTIDGGGTENVSAKVHLPSITEIGNQKVNGVAEGTELAYYANQNSFSFSSYRSPWYDATNNVVSGSQRITYQYISNKSLQSQNHQAVYYGINSYPIIVVPSTTKVSSVKYKGSASSSGSGEYYALIDMPLIIELSGGSVTTTNPTRSIIYKVYDENYNISSLKIGLDDKDNVVYSTVNLTKGNEYTYVVDGSSWAIGERHTYYFTAVNSNGTEVTENITITRQNEEPIIKIYDTESGEWKSSINIGSYINPQTLPPTLRLQISDPDNQGQDMFVYMSDTSQLSSSYPPKATIGTFTTNQEIEYTVPADYWETLRNNNINNVYFLISDTEYTGSSTIYPKYCMAVIRKATPAPTIEVESVDIGQQNIGFDIDYIPRIQTLHSLTNVSTYLDNELISSDNSPVADQEYTYTMTKEALYELTLGAHILKFTVTDDLNQIGTTEVSFIRINNAPSLITESALGNKRAGFTVSFTGTDEEADNLTVAAYMDSVSGQPFATVNMNSGDTESLEVTKAALYDLSLAQHTIYLVVTDTVGQSSSTEVTFTRVNDAPVIVADSSIGEINGAFDVSFSASDTEGDSFGISAYIDDHAYQIASIADVVPNQTYTYTVPKSAVYDLALGAHTIHIVATDTVGQSSSQDVSFTRVNNAPNIQTAFDGGVMYDDFDITFTVSDAESDPVDIAVKVDNRTVATQSGVTLGVPITETIEVENLSVGNHSLQIIANDSEGQSYTFTSSFTKDERPIITALDYGTTTEGFTTHYQVYDNGSQVTVDIKLDGILIDTQTITQSQYQTDLDITIADISRLTYDTHVINIKATDTNGEFSTKDITFVKKSVPTVNVVLPPLSDITQPFDITVNYDSADGDEVTIKAYIDGSEIEVS